MSFLTAACETDFWLLAGARSTSSAPRIVHVGHALRSAIHHLATIAGFFFSRLTSFQVANSFRNGHFLRYALIVDVIWAVVGLTLLNLPPRRDWLNVTSTSMPALCIACM